MKTGHYVASPVCLALALLVSGCSRSKDERPTPAASPPAIDVAASRAPAVPPTTSAAASAAPAVTGPRLLAHISPAWGRHGNLPPKIGVPVDKVIPDVSGVDTDGQTLNLREQAKAHAPLVLIFYRGGFCDFAAYHLRSIAVQAQAFRDSGAKFIFISPDTREQVAETKAYHKLEWPMVPDPELKIIKGFKLDHRIDDQDVKVATQHRIRLPLGPAGERPVVAYSAVFVVDREGKVKFAHADKESDRLLAYSQILDGIKQAQGAPKPKPP